MMVEAALDRCLVPSRMAQMPLADQIRVVSQLLWVHNAFIILIKDSSHFERDSLLHNVLNLRQSNVYVP